MPKKIFKKGKGLTREQLYALAHSFHPSQGIDALPILDGDVLQYINNYVTFILYYTMILI